MKVISDPSTWPAWQSEIIETDGTAPLGEGDVVGGRARLLGFEVNGQSSTLTATPTSFVEDVIVGVHMRIEYTVEESAAGTVITRRLTATLPAGFSGRVLSFFLKRRLKAMQVGLLDELVDQAEAG
jgi:hypothetical protein